MLSRRSEDNIQVRVEYKLSRSQRRVRDGLTYRYKRWFVLEGVSEVQVDGPAKPRRVRVPGHHCATYKTRKHMEKNQITWNYSRSKHSQRSSSKLWLTSPKVRIFKSKRFKSSISTYLRETMSFKLHVLTTRDVALNSLCGVPESAWFPVQRPDLCILTLVLFPLAGMLVLLLPGTAILEPDLRDSLAEAGHLRDPLQILAVGVRVQLEVRLEHLQLFLRECGAHALRLALVVTF